MSKADTKLQAEKLTIANHHLETVYRRLSIATASLPLVASAIGIGLLMRSSTSISLVAVGLTIGMYALTTFGIEVGYHRYFSHHAFQTSTAMQVILAILGSMAAQGGVIYWVANHRRHHQYTDLPGDPHSPHLHENNGIGDRLKGLWHAHIGWTFKGEITNYMLFAKDWLREPAIAKVNQLQQVWVILGLLVPTVLGGVLTWTWMGAMQGLIWGGLVRIFLGHQAISSTNSICHLYGDRPYETRDRSTNNMWLAPFTWGQSWHNNHHAFPNSAIVGLKWWQIDLGGWAIRLLEFLGLVWNVKVTPASKHLNLS